MEEELNYGRLPFSVNLDGGVVAEMKKSLPFEVKQQYYLKLPKQQLLNIAIFLMVADTSKLTKKHTNFIKTLTGDTKHLFETYFIGGNDRRDAFCGPNQLEHLGGAYNNNIQVLQKYQTTFTQSFIEHSLLLFKKKELTEIKEFPSLKHYGIDPRIEKPQEIIYLIKNQNTCTLCSYSSGKNSQKKLKQQVIERKSLEDKTKKIQKNQQKEVKVSKIQENKQKEDKSKNKKKPKEQQAVPPKVEQQKRKPKPIVEQQKYEENKQELSLEQQDENKQQICSITLISLLFLLILILFLGFGFIKSPNWLYNENRTPLFERLSNLVDSVKGGK